MKPRHAELLAADLDKATLIRYIDRFLMFYIRTADRLQRTSVWRDNLEGGLDYLQAGGLRGQARHRRRAGGRHAARDRHATSASGRRPSRIRRRCGASATSSTAIARTSNVVFVEERGQPRPARAAERASSRQRYERSRTQTPPPSWHPICALEDISAGQRRVRAGRRQADRGLPRAATRVYAIGNHDPASGANVLARGIVGDIGGELVVASPIYKQHFSLITGRCLEEPRTSRAGLSGAGASTAQIWVRAEADAQRARRGASAGWS